MLIKGGRLRGTNFGDFYTLIFLLVNYSGVSRTCTVLSTCFTQNAFA